jgi:Tfp pilus assembly protein PilO
MNRNVTATILIVLAIGIYVTFTRAKLAEVNATRAVNLQFSTAIDNASRLISVRDEVQKQYRDLSESDRKRLDKMLPDSVDNIRLVIDLDDLANKKRLVLRNIKASVPPAQKQPPAPATGPGAASARINTIPAPTLDTVSVSFSLTATYEQLIDFLQAIEANLRIMDVTKLSVAVNATGGYDFNVDLKTYWLRTQ